MQGIDSKDVPQEVTSSFWYQPQNQQNSQSMLLSSLQNSLHTHQKQQLLHEIEALKRQHIRQIQSLKLSQHLSESTYNFNIQQLTIKYDETSYENDCLKTQNLQLKDQLSKIKVQISRVRELVNKYESKIKNQEELIDQYKRSIEEQIGLEKQVIRVQYMQRELANKMNFQKALQSMEQNYMKKIQVKKFQQKEKDYQTDMKQIKKLCSTLTKSKTNQSISSSLLKDKQNVGSYDTKTTQKKQMRRNKLSQTYQNIKVLKNSSSYSTIEK